MAGYKGRRQARALALQTLYAWALAKEPIESVMASVLVERDSREPLDLAYFQTLTKGVAEHVGIIDGYFEPFLGRPFDEVSPIELAILQLSTYEVLYQPKLDYKIILNEAIELAKVFGAVDSHRFVNGALHQVAKEARPEEVQQGGNGRGRGSKPPAASADH